MDAGDSPARALTGAELGQFDRTDAEAPGIAEMTFVGSRAHEHDNADGRPVRAERVRTTCEFRRLTDSINHCSTIGDYLRPL